jgi:tRNA nucleotidyltransferase (CCA-adding enzyme)
VEGRTAALDCARRIITTHLGADFDAFGAAAGGLLLVPGARIAFPGSQETAVRRFVAAEKIRLPEVRVRELRRAEIESALVVDCSTWRRLGEVGELIARAGCPVEIIDHHPEPSEGISGATVTGAPVAATCTVLVGLYRERAVTPDPLTASAAADRGSTGTPAADLRRHDRSGPRGNGLVPNAERGWTGAPLRAAARASNGAAQPPGRGGRHRLGGVGWFTVARPDEQVEEAAYVVHRYAEIFDLAVVIAILEAVPQLVVIARSTHPLLDAGRLLTPLGGGGHATAAAARGTRVGWLAPARRDPARPRRRLDGGGAARRRCTPARRRDRRRRWSLLRLRIHAMPVERDGALIGVVTRQTLDNALSHGLGERPVTMVMRPGVHEVRPDASMEEVERAFMEGQARFVVVPQPEGHGIITRMDLSAASTSGRSRRARASTTGSPGRGASSTTSAGGCARAYRPSCSECCEWSARSPTGRGCAPTWWAARCATSCSAGRSRTSTSWSRATASSWRASWWSAAADATTRTSRFSPRW